MVTVRVIVEINSKRVLPFLCLQKVVRVGSVEDEALELQFADGLNLRTDFEAGIEVVTNAILAFEEAVLGIEIRSNLSMVTNEFKPIT